MLLRLGSCNPNKRGLFAWRIGILEGRNNLIEREQIDS
jgi:hypothetical protein